MGLDISVDVGGVDDLTANLKQASAVGKPSKWRVGTSVEYAVHLERGTSRMPPHPFLGPAVEDVMSNQADDIADNARTVDDVISGIAMAIEERAKHYATSNVPPGPDVDTGNLRSSIRAEKVD